MNQHLNIYDLSLKIVREKIKLHELDMQKTEMIKLEKYETIKNIIKTKADTNAKVEKLCSNLKNIFKSIVQTKPYLALIIDEFKDIVFRKTNAELFEFLSQKGIKVDVENTTLINIYWKREVILSSINTHPKWQNFFDMRLKLLKEERSAALKEKNITKIKSIKLEQEAIINSLLQRTNYVN